MHDIKAIRENPALYLQGWSSRGREDAQALVDQLLTLDRDLRAAQTAVQAAQSRRNDASFRSLAPFCAVLMSVPSPRNSKSTSAK